MAVPKIYYGVISRNTQWLSQTELQLMLLLINKGKQYTNYMYACQHECLCHVEELHVSAVNYHTEGMQAGHMYNGQVQCDKQYE